MTYHEKNTTVFLINSSLIFGYYLFSVYRLVQANSFTPVAVYSLWATMIVLGIIVTIIATIITQIVISTVHKIRTNEEVTFVEDERDRLIELRGTRNAYLVFSLGVFISMLSMVFGNDPLVMFNMLIAASFGGDIFGHISRLYIYRRGF